MSLSLDGTGRPKWRPPQPIASPQELFKQRCQKAKEKPFIDERPMIGSPSCSWSSFRQPLLRRFCSESKIHWKGRLGLGLDGAVWEVEIDGRVLALKVFWDNKAPEGTTYWAVQRECQNAALLQMIQAAITESVEPIYLHPEPKTLRDAVANLYQFSDEGRRKQTFRDEPSAIRYTHPPRLRQCLGWTKVKGEELHGLHPALRPRSAILDKTQRQILPSEEYYAIVYEFIPEDDRVAGFDAEVVQAQLDLFWRAGFCLVPLRRDNWKGPGILTDMADIICPWHTGWWVADYAPCPAQYLCDLEK